MNRVINIAAYKFVRLDDLPRRREMLLNLCQRLQLKGTILLAPEGINFFLAGTRSAIDLLLAELLKDSCFKELEVKESGSADQPFSRMLVKVKKEIIAFGVDDVDPLKETSPRVSPSELKQWLDDGRPVTMLDVRNNMEVAVGTFANAVPVNIDDFRDFPSAVDSLPTQMRDEVVVTFCTGGIRCEKAGTHLEHQGFRHVYQLDGGILKYFEECAGAHFEGECFVFDKRVALDSQLRETDTAQCYACQAILTPSDCDDPDYVPGKSCPRCYRSPEKRRQETIAQRHTAIRTVTTPLPGLRPYDNVRPIHVTGRFDNHRAIDFLCAVQTRLTHAQWSDVFERGELRSQGRALQSDNVVRAGQLIEQVIPDTVEPKVNAEIEILDEDDALVVMSKPAPLPMHPCGRFHRHSLSWILGQAYERVTLRIVHRLDANTSGVVVLCKTGTFARHVQRQFADGSVGKRYVVRVAGLPQSESFSSTMPISSKPDRLGARLPDRNGLSARTDFRVLSRLEDGTSLLEATPHTGRTNQIRVHLWDLELPVVGDPLYVANRSLGQSQTLSVDEPPMCLHAQSLALSHPLTGKRVTYTAPMPCWANVGPQKSIAPPLT